ncbi:PepSY-associated TM helix domain-containing protein [Leucobacter tardus]|uniref:PepSY domain-containing protein n=1 Tax=Leucobacter tardus TaxID=501483 RepID=A0A939TP00_9MICO|nr:PepSY-associated TM helix domain-containing protein [Leucobacter tardus]MBO2991063.1 PepSY domain-containing protein [Leucobacter tardus]
MTSTIARESAPSPGSPTAPSPRRAQRGWFAALLLRLHFFAGILVGPFIIVAAVSGGLYALTPAIEKVVYADQLEASSDAQTVSLTDQIVAAETRVGDEGTLTAVRPAPEPGDTTRVMFADPALGESESRTVFVDPSTGEIRGDLTTYGTSGALPMRTWIDQLHRSLHLGDVGRWYSELAASWLGIVAVAGLALWVTRFRKSRTKRDMIRPQRGYTGYRKARSWHTSIGLWVAIGALFLSATGITWSQFGGASVSELRTALGWQTPAVSTSLDGSEPAPDEHAHHHGGAAPTTEDDAEVASANPATFGSVLTVAQRENVNSGLVEIRPPAEPGTAWVVQEIQRSYPTEVDSVAIDGTTLTVVDRVDFADFSMPAKLSRWGIDLHMGSMFGLPNQIALVLLAAGIATLTVLGYVMWWRRRPTRAARFAPGTPPARGVLRGAPWWGIVAVIAGALAVGLFLPLVGYTLAAFVVLDVLIGFVQRRRQEVRS